MAHIPGPIAANPIYTQLQRAEQMLGHVYEGRLPALILYGPPGIGKSTLGQKVAKAHAERWRPERPGTKLGLIGVLHQHRNGGVVAFDDIDSFWDDGDSLDILKVALDTRDARYLSHTVGGSKKNSVKRFQINCGAVFLSNRNFRDPRDFSNDLWKSGIAAVKDRSMVVGLSFDQIACYEYTGWLATQGGMLSKISVDLKVGSTIRGKNGEPVVITNGNRHRNLTLVEANDVLEHFAKHANRYPSVGPRDLYKFARLRIGANKLQWEGWVEEQLEADPKWKLPADLYQYQIDRALIVSSTEQVKAVGERIKAKIGAEEASKVHDSPQVRSVVERIRTRTLAKKTATAEEPSKVEEAEPPREATVGEAEPKKRRGRPPKVKTVEAEPSAVPDEVGNMLSRAMLNGSFKPARGEDGDTSGVLSAEQVWQIAESAENEPDQATVYDPAICSVRYVVHVGGNRVRYGSMQQAMDNNPGAYVHVVRSTNYSELAKRREAEPSNVIPLPKRRGRPPKVKTEDSGEAE